jgi:hypothetical protein
MQKENTHMTSEVLLVWELIPEETHLYTFDEGSEMAELAVAAAGKYINHNDEEDDAVNQLNVKLEDHKDCKIDGLLAEGTFSKVSICGFAL